MAVMRQSVRLSAGFFKKKKNILKKKILSRFSFSDIRPGISELYSLPTACNGLPAVLIYDVPAER